MEMGLSGSSVTSLLDERESLSESAEEPGLLTVREGRLSVVNLFLPLDCGSWGSEHGRPFSLHRSHFAGQLRSTGRHFKLHLDSVADPSYTTRGRTFCLDWRHDSHFKRCSFRRLPSPAAFLSSEQP
jgi:hypothetical protein